MKQDIIKEISVELKIKVKQVTAVLNLLGEGNTVPFIARYRKEATGALDEEVIRKIEEVYKYQTNLLKRKEDVIRLIEEKGLLTEEIKNDIMKCQKLVEIEDLYRPFKEKKKTKASDAIKNGLEPLAKIIMSFPVNIDILEIASKYLNNNIKSCEDAIKGAKYIIAEWISDNANYRKYLRFNMENYGIIVTKVKKKAIDNNIDDKHIFEMYYDHREKVKYIKLHRILAMDRGEDLGILNVKIEIDDNKVLEWFFKRIIKNEYSLVVDLVKDAIKDSYKRLIFPSVQREIRAELKEKAEDEAILLFGRNLEKLLLTPPVKDKIVLGFDPAFRTGCKLAVVDNASRVLNISKIYPHAPHDKWDEAKDIIKDLIKKYNIDIIAIGNGTASRESEKLVSEICREYKDKKVEYVIVSEAGASVYSASKQAILEFPDLHVEERSAISIGRRLQDPLSELVKIDPKSIGVGQYQHDVNQKKLGENLDFVVSKAVNLVGVNINTASGSILKYVSGLTKSYIEKIIKYREKNGMIKSREEIIKNKLLSEKAYLQSIGFMRIPYGDCLLDKTSIHPESYDKTRKLISYLGFEEKDIGSEEFNKCLSKIDIDNYVKNSDIDKYTLEDIIKCLEMPNRDFRDDYDKPLLKSDILDIKDLKRGMELQGTVRNVVDFGAFVDIGLHDDGLVHISKLSHDYVNHPMEVVNVGDIVTCWIDDVNLERNKVSLTLLDPEKN